MIPKKVSNLLVLLNIFHKYKEIDKYKNTQIYKNLAKFKQIYAGVYAGKLWM